jgi:site-specific DNA-methyltransferase (adenine-specific)
MNNIYNGINERTIIHGQLSGGFGISVSKDMPEEDREFKTLRTINGGMKEKSIIQVNPVHYELSHPTEKPVRLAERIIALISDPGDTIYDPFMGSGGLGVACLNTGRKYIGSEIDGGYFKTACKRIKEAAYNNALFAMEEAQ